MFGQVELYSALNVNAVQVVVDAYGSGYAIFNDRVIPADCECQKTINFYMTAPYDPNMEIEYYRYSISCRAQTGNESQVIANAVITAINRVHYTGYFITCKLLQVIPPMNETDNYNSPVEVLIKKWI